MLAGMTVLILLLKGVVWLAINSTETGSGDYLAPARLASWMRDKQAAATATLMDASGSIGQLYGARTTPHMYIISPQGQLVYPNAHRRYFERRLQYRVPEQQVAVEALVAGVLDLLDTDGHGHVVGP